MLDGDDVTDVDDRECTVELTAYWPLGFFRVFLPSLGWGGGGGGGGGGGEIVTRIVATALK